MYAPFELRVCVAWPPLRPFCGANIAERWARQVLSGSGAAQTWKLASCTCTRMPCVSDGQTWPKHSLISGKIQQLRETCQFQDLGYPAEICRKSPENYKTPTKVRKYFGNAHNVR